MLANPESSPSAGRVGRVQSLVKSGKISCVFTEPQFNAAVARALAHKTARIGQLDPLGVSYTPGPELYFKMVRANANALASCLSADPPRP